MDDYRENIWGIRPEDRRWFQLLTLVGGIGGSIILTLLELESLAAGDPANQVARNIVLGIGASFVAAGFITWGLLQAKELIMPIGDWIREANERRRERLRQEAIEEGRQVGIEEGRQVGIEEGYERGYTDAQQGKPPRPPGASDKNAQSGPDSKDAKS